MEDNQVTFIAESIYQLTREKTVQLKSKASLQILLLLCGDVEIRPGPVGDIFTKRGLKIFHQNVQGLLSNIDKVQVLLKKFPVIDILTLSETH